MKVILCGRMHSGTLNWDDCLCAKAPDIKSGIYTENVIPQGAFKDVFLWLRWI